MHNRNLGPFFERLVGNSGCLFHEGKHPEDLICVVLFGDYYRHTNKTITHTVATKQLNGASPIPKPVWRYYTDMDGWDKSFTDMLYLVGHCSSTYRLHLMQERVHNWLPESGLSEDIVDQLNCYYISVGATRDQVAYFLAHVRHQLMIA